MPPGFSIPYLDNIETPVDIKIPDKFSNKAQSEVFKLYSEIIKKSAVFSSSDIFQTMNDIKVYKSRISYLVKIWNKYNGFNFGNTSDNEKLKIFNNQMKHIASCGSFLTFRTLENDNTIGKLVNGGFCRQRICPLCQRRRSLKLFSNIQQMLEPVKNKYAFIHLTLTIPNVSAEKIHISISDIFNSSKILFNKPKVKKAFKGIIRSLEVTYNKNSDTMHPHLHCLVLVNKSYFSSRDYISYDELRSLWGNIIGVNDPQIHLRKCTDLVSALCEVVKYSAKPIDTQSKNPQSFSDFEALLYYINVASALRGRRLLQTFGICSELSKAYHIDLNDDETEELLPEYTEPACYTFDEHSKEFYADIPRTEVLQYSFRNPSPEMLERIKNRNLKLIEYKKKLIRLHAETALRRMLRDKKNKK